MIADAVSALGSLIAMGTTGACYETGQVTALTNQEQNEPVCQNEHQDWNGSQGFMAHRDLGNVT